MTVVTMTISPSSQGASAAAQSAQTTQPVQPAGAAQATRPIQPVLETTHLRRELGKEQFLAVEDVSLSVLPGQIHALLGPNGAGKTTTVRMCATLLTPTAGSLTVDGVDALAQPEAARARLGLMLGGDLGFYPRATLRENLTFFADLQGVAPRERRAVVEQGLKQVGLTDVADRKAGALSRGMLQRLHLARATLRKPRLLLLDEPTTGLDPDVALQVRDLIHDLAQQGIGILLTSHSMPEVEELADTISLIGAGKIVATGSVEDIARFAGVGLVSTFTVPASAANLGEKLSAAFQHATVAQRASSGRWTLSISWPTTPCETAVEEDLRRELEAAGLAKPTDLLTRPATLEEAYLAAAQRLAR